MYVYNHYIIIYAHVHLSNWSIIYIEHLEPTAYWPSETEAQDIASHSQPAHAEGEVIICCPWNALPFEHLFILLVQGSQGWWQLDYIHLNSDSPWLLFATFWPTGQIDSGILHLLAANTSRKTAPPHHDVHAPAQRHPEKPLECGLKPPCLCDQNTETRTFDDLLLGFMLKGFIPQSIGHHLACL